jgi:hypothetical protein
MCCNRAIAKIIKIKTDVLPFWSRTDIIPILNGFAVVYFYVEDPGVIPDDFNLLMFFDLRALEHDFAVEITEIFADPNDTGPFKVHMTGKGAVPFWFIGEEQILASMADGVLTISELEALNPVKGFATHFLEELHPLEVPELGVIGGHPYPRMTTEAKGEIEGGGTFQVNIKIDQLKGNFRVWGRLKGVAF